MTTANRVVARNLRYFWRTNLGVVLGAACATAVLVGAMAVGDSVRLSLRDQALHRIGGIDAMLHAGDRHFRSDLAAVIARDLAAGEHRARVAPALMMPGIARHPEAEGRASIVEVFGVSEEFFGMSPAANRIVPAQDKAFVNERLAKQLGAKPGDSILLRIQKPSVLPRDMAMATVDDISFALRIEVERIVTDADFGRFGLRASQVPPFNLFVPLAWLQEKLQLENKANLLLASRPSGDTRTVPEFAAVGNAAFQKNWTLADAELHVQHVAGLDQLTSGRVFLDPPVVRAVRDLEPGLAAILTYFVDALEKGDESTPYSMVTAIGPLDPNALPTDPRVLELTRLSPPDLGDDGLVANEWLAKDLGAKVGDPVNLRYQVMGAQLALEEADHAFTLRKIIPIAGAAADKTLMPEFPGLADTESCRDWEPGIAIDLDRLSDADEKYWETHRGTPKAFVSLAVGQRLFGNRYGDVTAIRGPKGLGDRLEASLPRRLDPATLGLYFRDLRGPTLAAGTSATDFGGLFLGLSFFLIGAALLLTALLFAFGVEQRANEIGTLLAVGYRPARVRRQFLIESLILATLGGILGAGLGTAYTRAVLYGLGTLWQDAVGMTTLTFYAPAGTIVLGTVISILVAVGSIAFTLRRVFDRPAIELLQSRNGIPSAQPTHAKDSSGARQGKVSLALATICPLLAVAMVFLFHGNSTQAAGAFFGAGALLLIGGLAICRRLLVRLAGDRDDAMDSVAALGSRNAGRRLGRSLATVALLASGTFLVVAVQANRLEPPRDPSVRASGTGGFAFYGRSTLPVSRDLASEEGRDVFALTADELEGVEFVSMRVRDGDDASCLNLSLAQNPRLVGVHPKQLVDRGSFEFVTALPPDGADVPASPWALLDADYGNGVVPAIGDAASITWALHKSVGDALEYTDERGETFRVRIVGAIANSILQGNLVVSERRLTERFPSATGYRMFLIDAPAERLAAVESDLTRAFEDIGLELTSTADRLRDFNAVQNTYLLIFQALGGLGLLLGSIGVGMVVLRNALERRSELALLSAIGYRSRTVRRLVFSEHGILLALGLGSGIAAALLSVLPGTSDISLTPMALLVAAVAASGTLWVFLASLFATRGPLLAALQDD